ncbi:MAG: transporter substrate-binding domain-containing protein [Pseudomonadota bacterium]
MKFRAGFRAFALLFGIIMILVYGASSAADESLTIPGSPIISGSEIDYPPFCLVDNDNRADGFAVELLRSALAAMGQEAVFRIGPWPEVRGWLEHGEVRVLPLVGRTPEREAIFDFTFPYMSIHGAIVVRKDERGIHSLKDLAGKQVAVMKGDNAEEFLQRNDRGITIQSTLTFEQALQELSQGRHDAVVIQRLVALRLIQAAGLANLRVIDRPIEGFRQDFCFAVREGDREMLALLNEGLALVMVDGTYRRLHSKWFAALELPSNRPVIIGGDHNYPPFEYLDENGRPAGFAVELTRAIAREMNMDIRIRLGPWAGMVNGLENGEIDAIQGMFYSPERDRIFDFSQPYLVAHYVSVVRKESGDPPETIEALAPNNLVVQDGDVILEFLTKNGLVNRTTVVETQEDVLREIFEGKHDCALVPRISSMVLIQKNGWTNLVLGNQSFFSGKYAYAVPIGKQALLAQFSEGLKVLEENGEYRRIYEQWIGGFEDSAPSPVMILRYVTMVAVPLLTLLSAILIWSWSLRKQVASRTAALQESEKRYRLLSDNTLDVIWTMNLDLEFTFVNPAIFQLTGYTREEWIGSRLPDHCDEMNFAVMAQVIAEEMEKGPVSQGVIFEVVLFDKNRKLIPFEIHGKVIYDENRQPVQIQGTTRDITGRKLSEMRIEHLNRVLRSIRDVNQLIVRERDRDRMIREGCRLLVDNRGYLSALIVLTDQQDRPVSWAMAGLAAASKGLAAMFEQGKVPACCAYARDKQGAWLVHDREAFCTECPIDAACAEIQSMCVRLSHEGEPFGYLTVAADSGLVVDDEEISLFEEMAGDFAYALSVMNMEKKRLRSEEERGKLHGQLIQAQKMESVGRLAGGVAHDYNNMLSVIIGFTELAMEKTAPDDPLYDDLKEIFKASRRSVDITRQLLAFARRQTIQPELIDLNTTVEGMLRMLRRLIGEDIDLSWRPGSGLWPVKMDPSQVDQMLANLCVNARDAITGVGKITIETKNVCFDQEYCTDHAGFVTGDFVLLAISDDGCGMDRETRDSIFEPFFTTKGVGKGTGLGLAVVYGIVKQNGGFINVYSEPGQGTTFRIYLSRHAGETGRTEISELSEIPLSRGEIVMVVEDEEAILKLAKRVLTELGYTVMDATTPGQAMLLAEQHSGEIHLLITDVVMPEMNGRNLADQLQARRPDLKVLFMSGYTANVIAHQGVLEPDVHFIQKPFSNKDLAVRVRTALDS